MAPLGLMEPLCKLVELRKVDTKFLWPWNKTESPEAIFYFVGQVNFIFQILCLSTALFQLYWVISFSLKKQLNESTKYEGWALVKILAAMLLF